MRLDEEILDYDRQPGDGRGGGPGTRPPAKLSSVYSGGRHFTVSQFDPDGPFRLVGIDGGTSGVLNSRIGRLAEAPVCLLSTRIADFIKRPRVVIDDVSEARSPKRDLLRVRFHVKGVDPKKLQMSSGWFELDPAREWLLDSYHIDYTRGQSYDAALLYKESKNFEFVPDALRIEFRNEEKSLRSTTIYEFQGFEPGPVPQREFTLAAFGLPEIGSPGRRIYASRTPYWLFGLALAALAVALALKYYASRPRSEHT